MMKKKILFPAAAAVILAVMASACGNSGNTGATTAAQTTAAEAEAFAPKLNYDYADLVSNDSEAVEKFLGKAEEEKDAGDSTEYVFAGGSKRVMIYKNDEELNYGREDAVWLIEASVSELFEGAKSIPDNAAFFEALELEAEPELSESHVEDFKFADGKKVYAFEYEGYDFEILPDDQGAVHGDSKAVVWMPLEKEEMPEKEG